MTTPIEPGRFAVFDFETTALEAGPNGRVLEVAVIELEAAAVTSDRGEVLEFAVVGEWETLLNPGAEVGVGATHIHGIEPAHIVGAPAFPEVAGDLLSRLDNAIVVAHNASFDLAYLHWECHLAGIELPTLSTVCTRDLARALWAQETRGSNAARPKFTLTACCERADITFAEADKHRSLGDVRVTAQLLQHLVARADELNLDINTSVPRARINAPEPSGRTHLRPGIEAAQMTLDFPDADRGHGLR